MKLGIFDSGIGGEAIAASLQKEFPNAEIIIVNDRKNVPYGDKTPEEVISLTSAAIQPLLETHCDVIVLACNTATALAISTLRQHYPGQRFIGIEPMIKTAAILTKTNVIAVCATPATLSSTRYHELIKKYGAHLSILEPNCSTWAYLIEHNRVNEEDIRRIIEDLRLKSADVIVLGCTHYHWIKDLITQLAGDQIKVIEPSDAIGSRIRELLKA